MFDDLFDRLDNESRKLPHILIGEVTDNYNEEKPACVQVKILDRTKDMNITGWARVAMPFAGNERGFFCLPDIGDEVIIAFCQGEIDIPIVIGSLYTKKAAPPEGTVTEENTVKCIKTKVGHVIKLDDTKDNEAIEINTKTKLQIRFDDKEKSITITEPDLKTQLKIDGKNGNLEIKADKKITLKCGKAEIALSDSGNKVDIKGDSVSIKATNSLNLEGQQAELKGQTTAVKAGGKLDIISDGIANLKGSMVKLN